MRQIDVSDLTRELSDQQAWLRLLVEHNPQGATLHYCYVVIGPQPQNWTGESWRYESVSFLSTTLPASALAGTLGADTGGCLQVGDRDVLLPRVQPTAYMQHRPSFELHDRDRFPRPSFEYTVSRDGEAAAISAAGHVDFLVGPDSPSFTDLDSAYRGFFLSRFDFPANESVPSELWRIRIVDERAWLGPVHVTATAMTVEVGGTHVQGTTLEFFSPERRSRVPVEGPGEIVVDLPEGLAASNTWLWLTEGTAWRDFRALTGPWSSDEQLAAVGIEKEPTSRDEQAAVEALVYGGEGPLVEFKGQSPEGGVKTDRMFRTIAAFANGSGGTIVIGVDRDELTVRGLGDDAAPKTERDRIGQLIRSRVLPTPDFDISTHRVGDKDVLLVDVRRGFSPPYGVITDLSHRDKPEFFVRRGASTYPAQPSDLHQIVQEAVANAQTSVGNGGWRPR